MKQTLKQQLQAEFRMSNSQFDAHCQDLYVLFSERVDTWLQENYEFYANVERFISAIDGQIWLDIPFAYDKKKDGVIC